MSDFQAMQPMVEIECMWMYNVNFVRMFERIYLCAP